MLTPSTNTVLDPVASAIARAVPRASVHFGRFRGIEISTGPRALAQFDATNVLAAAELLAELRPTSITWCGTSAGWLGFDRDVQLCNRIRGVTGLPAYTSVLGLNEILERTGARRLALVSPYATDVQDSIASNYADIGVTCVAERHLGITDNFAFAEVSAQTLTGMVADVAAQRPDAIAVSCTNLAGAPLVHELELAFRIPVYDTVATAMWKAVREGHADFGKFAGWGSLFRSGL